MFKKVAARSLLEASSLYLRYVLQDCNQPRSFETVSIVAAFQKRDGIARGAVLQYEAFRRIGINVQLVDVTNAIRHPFKRVPHRPSSTYIFHSGGPQIATLLRSVLPQASAAYRIAYWAWELPVPPQGWPDPIGLVSEVWTCSSFSATSLRKCFRNTPVYVVPHLLQVREASTVSMGPPFRVLVIANSRSDFDRKNVRGSIKAFQRAFGGDDNAHLTLKLTGSSSEIASLFAGGDTQGITVINRYLNETEIHGLFDSSNVLLSLHRAEGFGLPMLEAMASGIPVVATRWSGNLDFMNDQNSRLIDAALIQISDTSVYSRYKGAGWADPDLEQAALALRDVRSNRAATQMLVQEAKLTVRQLSSSWSIPEAASALHVGGNV